MSFWDKALGGASQSPPPAASAPAPPGARPWWMTPEAEPAPQYQPPQQQQQFQTQDGQQLAVGSYQQQADPLVSKIANEGYIRKPPEWVQKQPTLYCEECSGVNFDLKSGRCFDCGYTTRGLGDRQLAGGRLNEFSGITGGGPVVAAARQTPEGGANLKNFGRVVV